MAAVSIDLNMKRVTNEEFIKKAKAAEPELIRKKVMPESLVWITGDQRAVPRAGVEELKNIRLSKGDSVVLDFGDHQVGYVTLKLHSEGSPQDAPAFLRLKFGERAKELLEDSASYDGWISRGWIQEEMIHIDVLPAQLKLPRRYAFRYLEIYAVDTSLKFQVVVDEAVCETVSAVSMDKTDVLPLKDSMLQRMDRVSLRTLQNCMQSVFEDGPKRDRRLWLGDLRLQALANYCTFGNMDLVKRCLYLFAGLTRDDGAIGACLFIEPEYIVDDTFMFDYSLFFVAALKDYFEASGDLETVRELWPSAYRQIELAGAQFDEKHLVKEGEGTIWCFLDWKEGLNKQAGAQAVYIYALEAGIFLAELLGETESAASMREEKEACRKAAVQYLWDEEKKLFVSGADRQISYASQVWMVLAGVKEGKEAAELLNRVTEMNPEMGMVTPYMNHHYVEALLICGQKERALSYMKYYWGGMLEKGADTFWEAYDPEDPEASPYGSTAVNSYCHAWSCTPSYLLRKYFLEEAE